MAKELISPSDYAKKADAQRQRILDRNNSVKVLSLTCEQWRVVSCTWMLISRGVHLPYLARKIENQLVCESVRNETQNYLRMHGITMRMAADAINCHEELKEFFSAEQGRPVLTHS